MRLAAATSAAAAAFLGLFLALHKLKRLRSPLRLIPGPPEKSWIFGHFFELLGVGKAGEIHGEWVRKYGDILTYDMFLLGSRVMICDADALKRVMISNVTNYVRPNYVRLLFEDFMGQGLLMAEGKVHDKQRKIFSAAFHFQNLSALSPNFSSQADKLVDSWFRKMPADSALVVDLIKEVHNLAMDIIGMVGFGYDFDSCNGRETEFGDAYSTVHSSAAITLSNTIQSLWPFKLLPTPGLLRKRRALHKLRSVVARIVVAARCFEHAQFGVGMLEGGQ